MGKPFGGLCLTVYRTAKQHRRRRFVGFLAPRQRKTCAFWPISATIERAEPS